MSFSFVHAADLHLDCPFGGIRDIPPEVAAALKDATFTAWDRIVDLSIESGAAFLVVAGDVYNSTDKSLRAQLRFRDGLARLAEAGIPSYIVFGNHDPAGEWSDALDWPDRAHFLSHKSVETRDVVSNGTQIAGVTGISYPKREVRENLAARYTRGDRSVFSVALLHCSCGPSGDHEPYAVCTLDDLSRQTFDYWALGHIHTRAILKDSGPAVVYPGNPQGLNPKETGARGCYLVHVDDSGVPHPEFCETDSIRWFRQEIKIDGMTREQEVITALRDEVEQIRAVAGRPALVRFELIGRGGVHASLSRASVLNDITGDLRNWEALEGDFVWVESLRASTKPAVDLEERRKAEDFVGDFLRTVQEARENPEVFEALKSALDPLFNDSRAHKVLSQPTDERMHEWLDAAEVYAFDALVGDGE